MEAEKAKLLKQVFESPEKHEKALKVFRETYEGLQIGEYSKDVFLDIIEFGTTKIAEKFKTTANAQLEKSGVTSPLLKANLLKGCDEVLSQFNTSLEGLVQSAIDVNKKAEFDRITARQMKVKGAFFGGRCDRVIAPSVKQLEIGIGGGITTECGKDIEVDWGKVSITPGTDTHYIYFVWPRNGGNARIAQFTEPKPNTETHFYIFWKSGTFDEIPM